MLFVASVGLVGIMYLQTLRHNQSYQYILSVGAVCWMLGNFMFMKSGFIPMATSWGMGFLLFTVVGERLELSKFLPTPNTAKKGLILLLALFFLGMWMPFHGKGNWLMGGAAIFISFWLLQFDMARIPSKKNRQFRYCGIVLQVGYLWLALFGIVLCFMETHSLFYDLYLHTFFLGFTFSMIWAHAPIILPIVLNIKIKLYHPVLWMGWLIFQLPLVGRIGSSLLGLAEWRSFFGIYNGCSILLMFGLMAAVLISRTAEKPWLSKKVSLKKIA
jgi:hypothetical protein